MNIVVTGRHVSVTKDIKEYAQEKVTKAMKEIPNALDAHIIMDIEKHNQIVEVNVLANHIRMSAKESSRDFHSAIDLVCDKLHAQARKYKQKLQFHRPRKNLQSELKVNIMSSDGLETDRVHPHLVSVETCHIKPMFTDEAILQMEISEEDFMMFHNADTEKVNVIYRRKDGNFGLIEPDF